MFFLKSNIRGLVSLIIFTISQTSNSAEKSTLPLTIKLPDITVTAEHREQTLSSVASSIDVFKAEAIVGQHINQLSDFSNLTSNLLIQPTETFKNITIRGVGGGGRNAGFDTRAGVYVDGVYMGQAMALDNPIFDIEQIEILKGPQGYLFGNNSDAGAINITTKQPTHEPAFSLTSGVGNYGYFENTLKLNGELTDKLTGRFIVRNEDHNGFVTNAFDGAQLKNLWRFASRAQLKLEANDQLDITFASDYINSRQDTYLIQANSGLFNQPLPASETQFDRVNVNNAPFSIVNGHGFSLNADYYFNNDAKFTAILAKRDWQSNIVNDNDYSPIDLLHVEFEDKTQQYSQEFRYTSSNDIAWPFVIGLYFSQETARNQRNAFIGQDTNVLITIPSVGTLPFDAAFGVDANSLIPLNGSVTSKRQAIYTNIDHRLKPNWVLHLGGRYSQEKKKLDFSLDGTQSGGLGIATLNHEKQRISQTFFSPMVGLSYQLHPNARLYGKFSRGFKSGGWNVEFLNQAQLADGFEYAHETVNAYEIGYKLQDKNTQFSASAFINHYHDYQVFQFANLGGNTQVLQLRNAANAKAQGLEFNLNQVINSKLTVNSSIAYLDARFEHFPNGSTNGSDASGQRLPDAPEFSGSLTLHYQAHLPKLNAPIQLSLQNQFQTDTYSGISNDPIAAHISGRNIINAFANYTSANQRWSISIWVKNLTDKHYALARGSDFLGNQISLYALPRTYGINGTINF